MQTSNPITITVGNVGGTFQVDFLGITRDVSCCAYNVGLSSTYVKLKYGNQSGSCNTFEDTKATLDTPASTYATTNANLALSGSVVGNVFTGAVFTDQGGGKAIDNDTGVFSLILTSNPALTSLGGATGNLDISTCSCGKIDLLRIPIQINPIP